MMLIRSSTHIVIDIDDNYNWDLEINGKKIEQNAKRFAIDLRRYDKEGDRVPTYTLEYLTSCVEEVEG